MINTTISEKFPKIFLASASPRRSELLKQIGINFEIVPSEIDESKIESISPEKIAEAKARDVASKFRSGLIIAADTIVVVEDQILGKPKNNHDAIRMLTDLSGTTHDVITGVTLIDLDRNVKICFSEVTKVNFRKLSFREISDYVSSGEAIDKAGSYGIQGGAAAFVRSIEGCYFNVVGLPLARLIDEISESK